MFVALPLALDICLICATRDRTAALVYLLHAAANQQNDADRAHDDELERVPLRQENQEAEPSGTAALEEGDTYAYGGQSTARCIA